ncbi:Ankyrin repeat-containing domain [Pseudocohnilembus persalinus]|uniref:Ankyrin repeat-containing domain n=1 Tax=Pseudocohnilembus persalinus TaxID=266149 RepID=A0A0V0R4H1_PSEPJ|nr:Ankyrin repeat-containing domain [Pseudocohnilembus persalinus]|eukprot:KRX09387.1 Ankyrin repeat-containing domain [Pseudocohnilembus persalinus]
MWLKESLLKFLRFLKKINLSMNEYVQFRQQFHKQELVSSRVYQREGSFVFFKNVKMGHIKQVEQALKLNKLFNLEHNQYGKTALHEAVIKENYDMVHLILSYGCDYDVKDKVGKTPLFYALKFQNWKIACLLLSKLCDPWSLPGTNYTEFCDQEMKQRLKIYRKINLMLQLIHSEVKKEYYIKKLKENMPDVDIWI